MQIEKFLRQSSIYSPTHGFLHLFRAVVTYRLFLKKGGPLPSKQLQMCGALAKKPDWKMPIASSMHCKHLELMMARPQIRTSRLLQLSKTPYSKQPINICALTHKK